MVYIYWTIYIGPLVELDLIFRKLLKQRKPYLERRRDISHAAIAFNFYNIVRLVISSVL